MITVHSNYKLGYKKHHETVLDGPSKENHFCSFVFCEYETVQLSKFETKQGFCKIKKYMLRECKIA